MFELNKLRFAYPGKDFLFRGLSLALPAEARVLLQGENGCGKSTLLNLITGRLEPTSGSITARAQDNYFYLPQKAESRILGINFDQDLELWEMAGLDPRGLKAHPLVQDFLPQFWELPLYELSQGTKQAYMLAIALSHPHSYLILDEPYPALDKRRQGILSECLSQRQAMLLVSHQRTELSFENVLTLKPGGIL